MGCSGMVHCKLWGQGGKDVQDPKDTLSQRILPLRLCIRYSCGLCWERCYVTVTTNSDFAKFSHLITPFCLSSSLYSFCVDNACTYLRYFHLVCLLLFPLTLLKNFPFIRQSIHHLHVQPSPASPLVSITLLIYLSYKYNGRLLSNTSPDHIPSSGIYPTQTELQRQSQRTVSLTICSRAHQFNPIMVPPSQHLVFESVSPRSPSPLMAMVVAISTSHPPC